MHAPARDAGLMDNDAERYCISSAGYNAHTVPLFKFYNVLKVEDIYNYRLLVLYYNLKHKNVPFHIASFMPKTSIAKERYPIRQPRLQPPLRAHEFISKTCKYRLPVFLNSISNNSDNSENFDYLRKIINEINNVTLVKFKSVTKSYMINQYSYYPPQIRYSLIITVIDIYKIPTIQKKFGPEVLCEIPDVHICGQ